MMHGQKNIKLYVSVFFSNYSKCYNCVFVCVCVCVCYCVFAHAQRTVLEIVSEPLHVNFMKLYHTGRYCI